MGNVSVKVLDYGAGALHRLINEQGEQQNRLLRAMQKMIKTPSSTLLRLSLQGLNSRALTNNLLKQGELLTARVISSSQKGSVLLQLGDMRLPAQTQNLVKEGDIIRLKVISAGKEPLLQIVPQSTAAGGPDTKGRMELSREMIRLLSIVSKFPASLNGQIVAKVVADSGENGSVRLLIAGQEYAGVTASKLQQGQTITLKVVVAGREPQLQIIAGDSKQKMASGVTAGESGKSSSLPLRLLTPAPLKDLRGGDLVVAKVVANNIKGELSLAVGNVVVKTATDLLAQKGEQIYLRLIKGEGDLLFEKVDPKEYLQQVRLNAYRDVLPRQQNLVESLQRLVDSNQLKGELLPANIKLSLETLIRQLPTSERVGMAPQLRQILSSAGLFAEARLLAGRAGSSDLKIGLSHIIALIRPLLDERQSAGYRPKRGGDSVSTTSTQSGPGLAQLNLLGDLLRSSDSAIARIQAQQLASLPQDEATQQVWHFELPVFHHSRLEQLSIGIERERGEAGDDASNLWGINLQMNLSPLGPMRARLRLAGKAISTTIWAEERDTLALVNQNLPTLKSAFERAGLAVNELRVLHGRVALQEESVPAELSLVNVKV